MPSDDTKIPTPLVSAERTVRPEWIDLNGHMNVAYYVLAFDLATEDAFSHFGLTDHYRAEHKSSTFTLELHVNYLREILEGEAFVILTTILGVDTKRLHLFHAMHRAKPDGQAGEIVATNENMFVHVDMEKRASSPFPDFMLTRLRAAASAHASLPRHKNIGRNIGF